MDTKSKDSNIYCDIDETLIRDPVEGEEPELVFNVYNEWFYKMVNHNLVDKLTEDFSTKFIIVWTSNSLGIKYAETIVNVLGLRRYTDLILTKPTKVYDDSPIYDWYQNIEIVKF